MATEIPLGEFEEPKSKREVIGKLADLLERQGIDVDDVGAITRVNTWQGFYKDDEGEAQTVDLVGLQFSPTWDSGPEWPPVQPITPGVVRCRSLKPTTTAGKRTLLLPDPQIGFWRLSTGELIPMHDRRAMDVALQLIAHIRPHRIVNLGDYLDLSEWSSKFVVKPEFVEATQPALLEGHRFLAEQRAASGPELEQIDLFEGNHDDRLLKLIASNAKSAMRLKRADEWPNGWPVLSVPNLLALDSLDVTYHAGYPAARVRIAGHHGRQAPLYALHGERLDMAKQARRERQSTVQGHDHRFAMHSETYEVDGEPIEVESWSVGCLCRTDGHVPSTHSGQDLDGRPIIRHESWQQGVGLVTETDDLWDLMPIRIRDGCAVFDGRIFAGEATS